jgi:hypothetical protein
MMAAADVGVDKASHLEIEAAERPLATALLDSSGRLAQHRLDGRR